VPGEWGPSGKPSCAPWYPGVPTDHNLRISLALQRAHGAHFPTDPSPKGPPKWSRANHRNAAQGRPPGRSPTPWTVGAAPPPRFNEHAPLTLQARYHHPGSARPSAGMGSTRPVWPPAPARGGARPAAGACPPPRGPTLPTAVTRTSDGFRARTNLAMNYTGRLTRARSRRRVPRPGTVTGMAGSSALTPATASEPNPTIGAPETRRYKPLGENGIAESPARTATFAFRQRRLPIPRCDKAPPDRGRIVLDEEGSAEVPQPADQGAGLATGADYPVWVIAPG